MSFYASKAILICNSGYTVSFSFSLYIYDHDRLYTDYIDIYYDYSGSTTSMRTRCRAAYRTLIETVVALLLPSQEDKSGHSTTVVSTPEGYSDIDAYEYVFAGNKRVPTRTTS